MRDNPTIKSVSSDLASFLEWAKREPERPLAEQIRRWRARMQPYDADALLREIRRRAGERAEGE